MNPPSEAQTIGGYYIKTEKDGLIMLNNLSIAGRLTKDVELKKTKSGVAVCRFSIANDRTSGENKTTDFFEVTAWRKTAEFITNYFRKGDLIIITGRIETYEYTDNDGVTRKTVQINAQSAEFGGAKPKTDNLPQNTESATAGKIGANNKIPHLPILFN